MAWIILAVVVGLLVLRLLVMAATPKAIKVRPAAGQLAGCPDSPNCVSSQAERQEQKVEPLRYSGPAEEAKLRLRVAIDGLPGTKVMQDDRIYLHAQFKTFVFGFIDDVEFLIDDAQKVIHVRSASRIGYSDLGTNRRRVETIRRAFEAAKTR
jgi:uncharacterized protein (DUF1499 family)